MFNTEIIHFLQSLDFTWLNWFMILISIIGTIPVVLIFILGITFAIDFKKGLVIVNIIAWTAMLTTLMKEQIDYPRPIDVDTSIQSVHFERSTFNLSEIQPKGFMELFSSEVLDTTRNDEYQHFGFPSGHASTQVALWVSLILLFRKRWMKILGVVLILLTFISRMYLGHHFLGDVLAGGALGLLVSGLLLWLVIKSNYLTALSHQFKSMSILWLPILLVPFLNYVPQWMLGSVIGLNVAASLIILQRNSPVFHVVVWKRILAALITLVFIFAIIYLNRTIVYTAHNLIEVIAVSVFNFVFIYGSIMLSHRLNLIRFRF